MGVFHERPRVAEPVAVTAFEQIEERPAVVPLHQRRLLVGNSTISGIVSFSVENKVVCGNGGGLVVAAQG